MRRRVVLIGRSESRQRTLKVEVTEVNEIANKSNAAAMYKEI